MLDKQQLRKDFSAKNILSFHLPVVTQCEQNVLLVASAAGTFRPK